MVAAEVAEEAVQPPRQDAYELGRTLELHVPVETHEIEVRAESRQRFAEREGAFHAVTLGGTYVYDDRYIILADPRLDSIAHWGELWTRDYFNGGADNLYRPLVSMTYAIIPALRTRMSR